MLRAALIGAVAVAVACHTPVVMARSLEEARTLAEDGDLVGAVGMLREVVAEDPKDTDAALFLGELLWNTGEDAGALEILEPLSKRGNRDATLQLARIAFARYDLDKAREYLATYRRSLRKGKKVLAEDQSGNLEERIDKAEGLLDRVQNIEVIDSVEVDAEEFFRYYPISPAAGKLLPGDALPAGFPCDDQTLVHMTESGGRMVWAAPDQEGNKRLYGSASLLGGEWESATPLGDGLAENGDAAYPYLMPDGVTLYYANDGDNSLGGYDIFLSRSADDGEFLQPANLGLPFNSPYNDYLLVVDEFTGAGWFATDRNRHPGKVTIYTFIPQDLRVNVAVDSPDLASLARLDDIRKTWREGSDYAAVRRAIQQGKSMNTDDGLAPDFLFPVPGNKVYTSLGDFRDAEARGMMTVYLEKKTKFDGVLSRLAGLRRSYAEGDRSQTELIVMLESQLDAARGELADLRNSIIRRETSR